ncbi:zinc ribbon domain-containing protein [Conexibacter sp. SYSU D00693]|uniref:zinc ribbon domain-containing protein n=1 Tax=Conexibacter sp. SYSU D00693 TaxID=2812560 RepID=UPI00196AC9A3|nr:zinc ribbon domain-containing protein [Conexibacter sp. SYSU D00693]
MKSPLSRIRRSKDAPEEQPTTALDPAAAAAPPPAPGEQPTVAQPPVGTEQPTASLWDAAQQQAPPTEPPAAVVPPADAAGLPAGVAPEETRSSSFRDRGRVRRRLRYLRRVRELGFRDLGGLVFDLHRFDRQGEHLVRGKLAALAAVDAELRALERALDERRDVLELREPGIAACPRCGALHGSDARFCPSCGVPLRGSRAIAEVADLSGVGPLMPQPGAGLGAAPQRPAGPAWAQHPPLPDPPPAERPADPATSGQAAPAARPQAGADQPTEVLRPSDGAPADHS